MRWHHRRDRMFVNQLRLAVAAQQQREIVEPGDDSLKLDPLDEEHRHRSLVPPHGVEKKILKILALIGHIGLLFLAAIPHRRSVCQTRSEEHTSELQSLMRISYAVFCLKKKKQNKNKDKHKQ